MVNVDTIKTFKIINPENGKEVELEMTIKDRLFLFHLENIAEAIRRIK